MVHIVDTIYVLNLKLGIFLVASNRYIPRVHRCRSPYYPFLPSIRFRYSDGG